MSSVYLSCKQAAKILALSQSTIKRLCDDEVLLSLRTPGGHRRISLRSVQAWQRDAGREATAVVGNKRDSLAKLHYSQCAQILLCDHRLRLYAAVEKVRQRMSVAELCDQTLAPALVQVGWMFERQEIDLHQVQTACVRMRGLLYHLSESFEPPASDAPCAVGASVHGDPADLSSLFAEVTLRELGWNAESLGAGLTGESLASVARSRAAELVWVCYTHQQTLVASVEHNRQLNSALPESARVVIGGGALSPELRRNLKFDFFGDSLMHLSNFASGLSQQKHAA